MTTLKQTEALRAQQLKAANVLQNSVTEQQESLITAADKEAQDFMKPLLEQAEVSQAAAVKLKKECASKVAKAAGLNPEETKILFGV